MFQKNFKIKNNHQGSILIFAVIIVSFMLLIAFSMAALVLPRLAVIREISNSVAALYAADSVLEWCIYEVRYAGSTAKPVMSDTIWGSDKPTYTITDLTAPVAGDECPFDDAYNHRAIGAYGGVSRALELH